MQKVIMLLNQPLEVGAYKVVPVNALFVAFTAYYMARGLSHCAVAEAETEDTCVSVAYSGVFRGLPAPPPPALAIT